MEIDKIAKYVVSAVVIIGGTVALAKHGTEIGDFLKGSADAAVGLGKGIASIG